MGQKILTTIINDAEDKPPEVVFFASDGLTPDVALAALRAVERELQKAVVEAEVERRVAESKSPSSRAELGG